MGFSQPPVSATRVPYSPVPQAGPAGSRPISREAVQSEVLRILSGIKIESLSPYLPSEFLIKVQGNPGLRIEREKNTFRIGTIRGDTAEFNEKDYFEVQLQSPGSTSPYRIQAAVIDGRTLPRHATESDVSQQRLLELLKRLRQPISSVQASSTLQNTTAVESNQAPVQPDISKPQTSGPTSQEAIETRRQIGGDLAFLYGDAQEDLAVLNEVEKRIRAKYPDLTLETSRTLRDIATRRPSLETIISYAQKALTAQNIGASQIPYAAFVQRKTFPQLLETDDKLRRRIKDYFRDLATLSPVGAAPAIDALQLLYPDYFNINRDTEPISFDMALDKLKYPEP